MPRRSTTRRWRSSTPHSTAAAAIHHNVGGLAHARGDYAAAEAPARRAVVLDEALLGPDHPTAAADKAALAPILDELGQTDEAERLLRQALGTFERVLGPADHEVGVTLANLGALLQRRGAPADAEALHRRALAVKEGALGELAPRARDDAIEPRDDPARDGPPRGGGAATAPRTRGRRAGSRARPPQPRCPSREPGRSPAGVARPAASRARPTSYSAAKRSRRLRQRLGRGLRPASRISSIRFHSSSPMPSTRRLDHQVRVALRVARRCRRCPARSSGRSSR